MNGHTLPDYQNGVNPPPVFDDEGACEYCGASGSDVKLTVVYGREVCGRCRAEAKHESFNEVERAARRAAKAEERKMSDTPKTETPATCPKCGLPHYTDELAELHDLADICPGDASVRASDFGIESAVPWCQCDTPPCFASHLEDQGREIPSPMGGGGSG